MSDSESRRVKTYNGWTDTNPAFFIEAEPKLGEIRRKFLAGELKEFDAENQIRALVGMNRFGRDYISCRNGETCPPDRESTTWEVQTFERWRDANPLVERCYYNDEVVIKTILRKEA